MKEKNLPFIPLFPLDLKKISEAKLLPESKHLFDLSRSGQGLITCVDLEDNVIIMLPAYNKGDSEGKELDKYGKPLPKYIRSLTSRTRGIINPQATGGNLHKQLDERYGLNHKPRVGMGVWKDHKGGIEEITIVSSQQIFSIKWKRAFKEYFKLRSSNHASHSQTLLREMPYIICEVIIGAIYRELKLKPIAIKDNPAISDLLKGHFSIQQEWQIYTIDCLRDLFIDLLYRDQNKLIEEIIKEHQLEEKEFKDKTDFTQIMSEAKYCVNLLKTARDGDILGFRAALSNLELHGVQLSQVQLLGDRENALSIVAKAGHVEIITEINDYFNRVSHFMIEEVKNLLHSQNKDKKSPLVIAVENRHIEVTCQLLSFEWDLNNVFNALVVAIKTNNLELFKVILSQYPNNLNELMFVKDREGRNLLMTTVINDHRDAFVYVMQKYHRNDILKAIDNEGNDTLTLAIKNKRFILAEGIARRLGVDFNFSFSLNFAKQDFKTSKLIVKLYYKYAPENAHKFLYRLLSKTIKQNNQTNFKTILSFIPKKNLKKTHSILNLTANYAERTKFIEEYLNYIAEQKIHISYKSKGVYPLALAWQNNNSSSFELLFNKGIVTLYDYKFAVTTRNQRLFELILSKINIIIPCIAISVLNDNLLFLELLLKKIPDVNHPLDGQGLTMLILAIKDNALNVVKYLIENKNADVCQTDAKSQSPLLIAAKDSNIEIFKLILNSASHPQTKLIEVYKYVNSYNKREIVDIILAYCPEIQQTSLSQNPQVFVNTIQPSIADSKHSLSESSFSKK